VHTGGASPPGASGHSLTSLHPTLHHEPPSIIAQLSPSPHIGLCGSVRSHGPYAGMPPPLLPSTALVLPELVADSPVAAVSALPVALDSLPPVPESVSDAPVVVLPPVVPAVSSAPLLLWLVLAAADASPPPSSPPQAKTTSTDDQHVSTRQRRIIARW